MVGLSLGWINEGMPRVMTGARSMRSPAPEWPWLRAARCIRSAEWSAASDSSLTAGGQLAAVCQGDRTKLRGIDLGTSCY